MIISRKTPGSSRQHKTAAHQLPVNLSTSNHANFYDEFNELRVGDDMKDVLDNGEHYADNNSEFEDAEDENLIRLNECYPPVQLPLKSCTVESILNKQFNLHYEIKCSFCFSYSLGILAVNKNRFTAD